MKKVEFITIGDDPQTQVIHYPDGTKEVITSDDPRYLSLKCRSNVRLYEALKYVQKLFFPQWNKNHRWSVKEVLDFPYAAISSPTYSCIGVSTLGLEKSDACIQEAIIHEICHIVTKQERHAGEWSLRMIKAVFRAHRIGNNELARWLMKDL